METNKLLIQQQIPMRKFSDIRPVSPIRSPIKTVIRPVSPIRNSPFSKQIPMSPLRIRNNNLQSSRTPTKVGFTKRAQTDRQPVQRHEAKDMVNTIKNGMGLFQQLAFKNKLASERKENNMVPSNSRPFEVSQKYRNNYGNFNDKNSFAALIHNVKQIESIQAPRTNQKSNSTIQLSFKAMEKSKQMENTVKVQCCNKNPLLQSFGMSSQTKIEKKSQKTVDNKKKELTDIEYQKQKAKMNEQVNESYSEILFMIKKASEGKKQIINKFHEESVKISYEENDESLSMSPFL